MLDQSFSSENFRRIFDIENRKGNYIAHEFFPDISKIDKEIAQATNDLRNLRKKKNTYSVEDYEKHEQTIKAELNHLKLTYEKTLDIRLEEVCQIICSKNLKFGISSIDIGTKQEVYTTERNAVTFFALKQLQFNIRKLYKVRTSNRHQIVRQLSSLLNNNMPKHIIRADIKSFFESVQQKTLLQKLYDDALLSPLSRNLIRKIFFEFNALQNKETGLPRGIGISSHLAEIYMRKFDNEVKKDPNVFYYARYVDDIVVLHSIPPNSKTNYNKYISNKLEGLKLKENTDKSFSKQFTCNTPFELTYLGYSFKFCKKELTIGMSKHKINRYKKRIITSFDNYEKMQKISEQQAKQTLTNRIKFLTSNTRLLNNKRKLMVGIYFSNTLLTRDQDLDDLDNFLQRKVEKLDDNHLKDKLKSYSFLAGFKNKIFNRYTTSKLAKIVRVWKYDS